jgi:hypothetical protein
VTTDLYALAFEVIVWYGGEPCQERREAAGPITERDSFLDLAGWTFTAPGNWRREYRGRRLVIHCLGPTWRWRLFGPPRSGRRPQGGGPAGDVRNMRGPGHDSPRQCAEALFEELRREYAALPGGASRP